MLRRKHCSAKGHAIKTAVPYGFEKVEYLQAIDHSPMINTNYVVSSSTGIKAVFSYKTDSAQHFYCGANQVLRPFASNQIGWGWYGDFHNAQFLNPFNMEASNSYTIYESSMNYLDDLRATLNGNSMDIVKRWKEEYAIPIYMFGCGTGIYNNFKGEIYNVKISENNSIVRDFIPSLDRTGTPCMFDLVTRKNFYNAGTGQFIYKIPEIIPNNYTRIDYLESTGTQWIDTELCMDSYDIRICIKGQALQTTDKKTTICGYWSNYGIAPEECAVFIFNNPIKNTTQTQQIMLNNWFDFSINPFEVFTIDVSRNKNDNNVISVINGIAKTLNCGYNTKLKSKSPETFILFGAYTHGNGSTSEVGNIENLFTGRIWYTDLYKDGQLVLKFVPCLDPTGTPCMYDTVTQKTYYNAGTGDFLYPSPTSSTTYSMRRPQAEYAKMTDTGVRRLYHVPVDYEGSIEEYASENGFKLLNETESPNEEGKYYAFRWVETDTEIMTEWYETEPPTDEFGQVIENNNEQQSTTFNLRRPAPIDNTVYSNNAQWAKITDTGVHKIYHTPIGYEGSLEDYAIENGYKRLIETESPNEEGKYYAFRWVETDDTLSTEWFEVDPPQEKFIEENLDNPTE